MSELLRIVERLEDNKWQTVRLAQLKQGDIFRMFEHDGTPVTYKDEQELYAVEDTRFDEKLGKEVVQTATLKEWREYNEGQRDS